ncbi:MAG: TrkA C-terminal domain-containing protein, partial [Bacteroidota bacterium]|nr:TrkA C-terminal domain-containing protein [Bacteroidota bacterium]
TWHVLIHAILLSGIVWGSFKFLTPFLIGKWGAEIGSLVASASTLAVMAPLLWSLSFKRVKRNLFRSMWVDSRYNHGPLMSIAVLRFLISLVFVMTVLVHFYSFRLGTIVGFAVLCMLVILFSKQIRRTVIHLEKTMIRHLNERENAQRPRINNLIHDIHLAEFEVSPDSELIGRYLYKADFRNNYGVSIVSIHRGSKHIHIPGARDQLMPYDRVSVVGNDEQIKNFGRLVELRQTVEFSNEESVGVEMKNLTIEENSFFIGKTIRETNFHQSQTLVISIQRKDGEVVQPAADMLFQSGDLVTLVGPKDKLQSITQGFCSIS